MVTVHELEQVRRRVERLEIELGETRQALAALERRVETPPPVAIPPVEARVEVPPAPAPLPVPKVTPPPLPPVAATTPARVMAAVVAEVKPAGPSPLQGWLERLQLWPPSADGEGGDEARLGAWWATRVGTLLAVVGVVFFGVYVSRHTPPWVKFAELLVVSAGVCALGLWLARRLAAFGEVVFAGGLALGFFTAYAGHAVPAVRIFPELWMSILAQGMAVAGIVAAALWRRSAMIATLAVGLGYVTALVSGLGGLEGYALGAGALLAGVAVALRRVRGWEGPSVLAMPGAYAVFALGLYQAQAAEADKLAGATWPYLVIVAVLFFARDWRRGGAGVKAAAPEEVWFQGANSSLALGCGLWAALGWHRAEMEWFYGVAAVLLAAGAWRRARQEGMGDAVSAVLLAKAAGALTLAVIEVAGARDAAIALLVQAWVLAWTARRIGSRVLAVATGAAALVASYFFAAHGLHETPIWSVATAKAVGFSVGLTLLASEAGRWLITARDARRMGEAIGAAIATLGLLVALPRWTPGTWEPALALGLTVIFGAVAWWRKAAAPGWAALTLGAAAQVWWWAAATETVAPASLGWNALVLGGALVAAGAVARSRAVSGAAWALATAGTVLTLFALRPAEQAMFIAAAIAVVFGAATGRAAGRHLAWVATLALSLGAACWLGRGLDGKGVWIAGSALAAWALPVWLRACSRADEERRAEPMRETMERLQVLAATLLTVRELVEWFDNGALGLGLAGAALAAFALALRPGVRPALVASWLFWLASMLVCSFGGGAAAWWVAVAVLAWTPALAWVRVPEPWKAELAGWRTQAGSVQVVLASLLGLVVGTEAFSGAASVFALTALCVVAAAVARPGRVGAAKPTAGALAACLIWMCIGQVDAVAAAGWGAGMIAALVAAVTVAALPLWLAGRRGEIGRVARYAGGGGGLALAFITFATQRGELAAYATVGWGLAAIALFMAGLFGRTAPYRVLGLIGLGLCLPRMFIVDLDSALHRIVAFIGLGVVLLWVGFSYHRFKHLVSDRESRPDSSPTK